MIEDSPEIREWLGQFPTEKQIVAIDLLLRIKIFSRDSLSEWLKETIEGLQGDTIALYAVRKLPDHVTSIWDTKGEIIQRPGSSLGSEDLIQSVISGLAKSNNRFLDNPSLSLLRKRKVRHIALIDDNIGSGERVSGFVHAMVSHPTFLSWWSFGWISVSVISLLRTACGEKRIKESLPGSDHGLRKFPKSNKVHFISRFLQTDESILAQWGGQFASIRDLCNSVQLIPRGKRLGFANTMSNVIFHHSVPDTVPGILWYKDSPWKPLFPGRSIPAWLPKLLSKSETAPPRASAVSDQIIQLLILAKKGIKRDKSLAHSLGVDVSTVIKFQNAATAAGFLTAEGRLTPSGADFLKNRSKSESRRLDFSLFIPKLSCVGWKTAQPSVQEENSRLARADSLSGSPLADGEAGSVSLEKTDAKTFRP